MMLAAISNIYGHFIWAWHSINTGVAVNINSIVFDGVRILFFAVFERFLNCLSICSGNANIIAATISAFLTTLSRKKGNQGNGYYFFHPTYFIAKLKQNKP